MNGVSNCFHEKGNPVIYINGQTGAAQSPIPGRALAGEIKPPLPPARGRARRARAERYASGQERCWFRCRCIKNARATRLMGKRVSRTRAGKRESKKKLGMPDAAIVPSQETAVLAGASCIVHGKLSAKKVVIMFY